MREKLIEEKQNDLFNRKEVVLEISSDISPSNTDVQKLIAEKFSVSEANIKVKGIYGNFGTHEFTIYANVYKTVQDKETTEIKTKKERNAEKKAEEERIKAILEEKKKAAKPKEEVKEEASE